MEKLLQRLVESVFCEFLFQMSFHAEIKFNLCTKMFKKHASIILCNLHLLLKGRSIQGLELSVFLFKSSRAFRKLRTPEAPSPCQIEAKIFLSSLLATLFDYEFIF